MSQSNFERPASASNDDESLGTGNSRIMHDESNYSSLLDVDGDSSGSTTNSKQPNSVPPSLRDTVSGASNATPVLHQPSAVTATTATPAGPVLMLVSADKYDYRLQGGWQKQDYRPLNERYRNWRKNTYFMYDFSTANVTVHPSRTVEWLPDIKKERLNVPLQADEPHRSTRLSTKSSLPTIDRRKSLEVEFYCQKAIVGSLDMLEGLRGGMNAAAPNVQHAIFMLDIRIPVDDGENFDINPPSQFGLNDWGSQTLTRIETTRFVPVGNREIFRIRHMPQLSDLVAVRTRDESYIGIYDLQDSYLFESYPLDNVQPNPALALTGFAAGSSGYGLNWHPHLPGYVVAASYEPKIAVWNIEHNSRPSGGSSNSGAANAKSRRGTTTSSASTLPSTTTEVLPLRVYEYHTKAVQDVAWHPDPSCRSMFVSVGDDGMLGVCDIRESPSGAEFKPALFTKAHDYPINSVAWSPASPDCSTLLATGAMDGTIGLWDLRRPDLRLHTIAGTHTADIVQIAFNPHDPLVIASAALDNRLLIFDLGCIGAEKFVNLPQQDVWPSELAFAHDGHSAPVNEFAWNPYYERMLISVADDNMCQVTEISEHAWNAWHKRRHYGPLALSAVPPIDRVVGKTALDADEIPAQEELLSSGVAGGPTASELSRRQQFKLHTAPEFRFPPSVRSDSNMNGI